MDCIVHGVVKSRTRLSDFHFQCKESPFEKGRTQKEQVSSRTLHSSQQRQPTVYFKMTIPLPINKHTFQYLIIRLKKKKTQTLLQIRITGRGWGSSDPIRCGYNITFASLTHSLSIPTQVTPPLPVPESEGAPCTALCQVPDVSTPGGSERPMQRMQIVGTQAKSNPQMGFVWLLSYQLPTVTNLEISPNAIFG